MLKNFQVSAPRHYQAQIGETSLSCAWFGHNWELAYRKASQGWWEPVARSDGLHDGGGMFLAAKRFLEDGRDVEEILDIVWLDNHWVVQI